MSIVLRCKGAIGFDITIFEHNHEISSEISI